MRFFFDIDDGDGMVTDEDGAEFANLQAARAEAAQLLPDLAREALPNADNCALVVRIRDAKGGVVATLSLAAEWRCSA